MSTAHAEVVGAAEVRDLLGDPSLVVVDARYWMGEPGRGRAAFEAGHLPGARFVDLDVELAEPPVVDPGARPGTHPGGRHPRPTAARLQAATTRLGIDDDSTVLVHDQAVPLSAAWFCWLLRDAGFTGRLLVLDGGLDAWQRAGGEVTTQVLPDGRGTFVPRPGRLPCLVADEVTGFVADGHHLVDVRTAVRFRGEAEPVDPVAGHVPGALNLPVAELLHDDGTFRAVDELRSRLGWMEPGDAFSCGSGLTASLALLAAEHAGVRGLGLYAGSWSDWISDPSRPVHGLTSQDSH